MPAKKYAETQRKWEERNPDYYKEYYASYYLLDKENNKLRKRKSLAWLKEAKRFRNILLEIVIQIGDAVETDTD